MEKYVLLMVGAISSAVLLIQYSWFLHQIAIVRKKERLVHEKIQREIGRRTYELAVLKAIGDRIGYSLNVQNIADVITGSLHQLVEYSVVAYMLVEPERVLFKAHLEESVSRVFINTMKSRMLESLSALANREFGPDQVEELITGAVFVEDLAEDVKSFFNIPLIISDKVVGIITVAHVKPGLYKEEEMTILYKITLQASTAVTKLEEVVRIEERKLNAMVESMTEGVVMIDQEYRILVINPAAKRLIGNGDIEDGPTIFDFIGSMKGKFDIRGKLEESIKLGKTSITDDVIVRDRYYQIIVSPVTTYEIGLNKKKEEVLGGVAIFHDITHEKIAERIREDLTAMIVHELRSPLTGIRLNAELMQDAVDSKKKTAVVESEVVDIVHENASRMLDLVNDMLDVAKMESGKFSLTKSLVDPKVLIDKGMALFHAGASQAGVTFLVQSGENIPTSIAVDENRMIQVISNLVSNALKVTDKGGVVSAQIMHYVPPKGILAEAEDSDIKWFITEEETVRIPKQEALIVAVTDSGVGIAKEEQSQLFNKFKQIEKLTRQKEKGTGLGLAIVKGIVEAHGGVVGIASVEGQGSTFYFTVPLEVTATSVPVKEITTMSMSGGTEQVAPVELEKDPEAKVRTKKRRSRKQEKKV
jgi:signal transduction histidine kinase/PAS domain-containing protein